MRETAGFLLEKAYFGRLSGERVVLFFFFDKFCL